MRSVSKDFPKRKKSKKGRRERYVLLCLFLSVLTVSVKRIVFIKNVPKYVSTCFKNMFHVSCFETVRTHKKPKTQNDMSKNQTQIEGLKQRLGAAFGKFGRNGSTIGWSFQWSDSKKVQTGYNRGILQTQTSKTFLAILKDKIFNGFLLGKTPRKQPYTEAINYINVYLLGETNKEDILLFCISFHWISEGSKKVRTSSFEFHESIEAIFSKGERNYIEEMFAEFQLKTTSHTATSAISKLEALRAEIKSEIAAKTPQQYEKLDVRRFTEHQQEQAHNYCAELWKAAKSSQEQDEIQKYYEDLATLNNW